MQAEADQKGFVGRKLKAQYRLLTKQQIAVYKMAQKPALAEQGSGEYRIGLHQWEKRHAKALIANVPQLIHAEVDAKPGAKACSMNIHQRSLVATPLKS